MPTIEIERLALDVPGLSPEQGQQLGRLIARKLAASRWMPAPGSAPEKVSVAAPAGGSDLEGLAAMIAGELQRRMA